MPSGPTPAALRAIPRAKRPSLLRDREGRAAAWRGAWLIGLVVFTGLMAFTGLSAFVAGALAGAALPVAVGFLLPRVTRWRGLGVADWALGGLIGALLTGGVTGPLAIWCLLPIAAAAMVGGANRLAAGAALAAACAAVCVVAQLAGLVGPTPAPSQAFLLAALALITTALGLGAGLILGGREAAERYADRALEARTLLRALDAQPHLIFTANLLGKVRRVWGAAVEGVSSEALVRRGLEAIASPEDAVAIREAYATGAREGAAEIMITPATAQDRAIAVSFRRLGEDHVIVALRDATAEQAREAALEQARGEAEARAAGRSRFLANMSHELRTPLNAIMGFSDIMRVKMFGPLEGRYSEYADLIHESGQHLLDLISDLLDMSKIEAERYQLDREQFDAREAVTAALRLMRLQADGAGVALRGVLPSGPLEIDADRRAIKQIVLNLVSNALKFTPKGGAVTVTAQAYQGQFELIVADTGVGISPEDLARLGRPFEQAGDAERKALGSGLGLSLVRAFAELHGGEMQIESRLGAGTTVTVRLQAEDVAPPAPPPLQLVTAAHIPPMPAEEPTPGNVIPFAPQR
jgi:two-component system, cell cycle sensor histidine kinase DivJ